VIRFLLILGLVSSLSCDRAKTLDPKNFAWKYTHGYHIGDFPDFFKTLAISLVEIQFINREIQSLK